MSELIEKQKVLDALREIATEKFSLDDPYGVYINVLIDVEEKICSLPVVQPNGPDNLANDSQDLVKDLANDDAISRKAAIDALGKDPGFKVRLFGKSYDEGRSDQWFRDVYKLTTVPSAQPERRKGRWRKGVCECGYDWAKDAPISSVPNFCPQCGADMRGEQE